MSVHYFVEIIFRFLFRARLIAQKVCFKDSTKGKLIFMFLPSEAGCKVKMELPSGFTMRNYRAGDIIDFYKILYRSNIGSCSISYWKRYILSDGFFVVECDRDKRMVGAVFAAKNPRHKITEAGTLEYLIIDPSYNWTSSIHKAMLAYCLALKATERLRKEGFVTNEVYCTNEVRGMYKKLGWQEVSSNNIAMV